MDNKAFVIDSAPLKKTNIIELDSKTMDLVMGIKILLNLRKSNEKRRMTNANR